MRSAYACTHSIGQWNQRALMKKFAKKTVLRSLASACFVGTTCCSALLYGQQLAPRKEQVKDDSLPPIVSGSQNVEAALPPIVSGADAVQRPTLPPIVQAATLPVVQAQSIQTNNELPAVVQTPSSAPVIQAPALAPVVQASSVQGADNELPPIVQSPSSASVIQAPTLQPVVQAQSMQEANSELPAVVQTPSLAPVLQAPTLAPVVQEAEELPPIVPATSIARMQQAPTLAPVVQEASELPPVVSAAAMTPVVQAPKMASVVDVLPSPAATGTPTLAPVVTRQEMHADGHLQRGKNFPMDGEKRIADFIKANTENYAEIENTGFGPLPQDSSPGNTGADHIAPVVPVPIPDIVSPQISHAAPSIGGQAAVAMPQPVVVQAPHVYDPPPQHIQPGTSSYFESAPVTGEGYDVNVTVNYGGSEGTFDCCGFICDSRNYLIVDGLYWEREDGVFRASNISFIDDQDHSWGGRITWGTKRDSTRGIEVSYMQFNPLFSVSTQFNPPGTLFGALFGNAAGNLPANAFTAFRNGTYAQQFHKTDLHSAEVNRTWWGSDVAKAFIGARYIHFDDEFRLSMANTTGQQGFHSISTTNNMFGLHAGGEILYDIGYRLSFSFGAKLGGYINFSDGDLSHVNAGAVRVFGSDEDTDFAWSGELGMWARYKLSPNVRLRAGYEGFALFDVKDVEAAFSTIVTSGSGRSYPDGNALFHGPSIGIEIYR